MSLPYGAAARLRVLPVLAFVLLLLRPAARADDICATVFVNPDQVSDGQQMSVVLDMMNCSADAMTVVGPCAWGFPACPFPACIHTGMSPSPAAVSVSPVSGPEPACPQSLVPYEHAYFTWTFLAAGSGTVDFTITMSGWRGAASTQYTATGRLTVQRPAALSVTLSSEPVAAVKYRRQVLVHLDVLNYGESGVNFVHDLTQSLTGSGLLCLEPCPDALVAPLCPPDPLRQFATILGGSATRFTWLYTARSPGAVTLQSAVVGSDHNFPLLPPAQSNTSSLTIAVPETSVFQVSATAPDRIVAGQQFDLKVRVVNGGAGPVDACQSGFVLRFKGPRTPSCAEGGQSIPFEVILDDLRDRLLPQCYVPADEKWFTLRCGMPASLGVQAGYITLDADGVEAATGDPVFSQRLALPLEITEAESRVVGVDPNPFHPLKGGALAVRYVIAGQQANRPVSVRIYSVDGELVETIADQVLPVGVYDAAWDGRNSRGERVAGGIYMVLFEAHAKRYVRKVAVIR